MQVEMNGGMNDTNDWWTEPYSDSDVISSYTVHCRKDADRQTFRRAVPLQTPEEQRAASDFSHPHLKVNILCWMIIMYEQIRC